MKQRVGGLNIIARLSAVFRSCEAWISSWCRRIRAFGRHRPGGRISLVHHIVSLQLAITAIIGVLALSNMYGASQVIVENSLSHWASQWTSQLNELGAPFYLSDQRAALLNVERFVATYPEVAFVNWYAPDGSPLFSVAQEGRVAAASEQLSAPMLEALAAKAGESSPHLLQENAASAQQFRLIGPIWTESLLGDGLMDFVAGEEIDTVVDVLGFVEVELDYSPYHQEWVSKLWVGSLFLLGVLALSWAVGRWLLRKALQPLLHLQEPLAELANGNMDVSFTPSPYAEIQNIVKTLEDTTRALQQRDRRLVHLATHDSLTGLYNRYRFVEELRAEIERLETADGCSALFFIDLDQFKYVNDTCGHPAGDELLQLAAQCISEMTRTEDVVARFGGDEFAVLARDVTRGKARDIGSKILDRMRSVKQIHGTKIFHLQCSVGIAMVKSQRFDSHDYLAQADIACHAAKAKGRNRLEFYKISDKEHQQMSKEIGWVQTVRRALERDSFVMMYQPLVNVRTRYAHHYEVLLRLETENAELIPPDVFLRAAARFGLVVDIDWWVVQNAMKALAEFRRTRPEMIFSINLSASVFDEDGFASGVMGLLEEYRLPPDAVVFEITEQLAMRFATCVDKQLLRLRELGCRFAIDDFGTGYSSFSYLKNLPVDYLKIDGSFIEHLDRDIIDQTMVRMIGEVARAAGIETVAEYVQNEASFELLEEFGIDYAQGFYLGRPERVPEDKPLWPEATGRRGRVAGSTGA